MTETTKGMRRGHSLAKVKIKEIEVDDLTSFTKVVEDLSKRARKKHPAAPLQGNWYRGIGKANTFELLPHLYRHPTKKDNLKELILLEKGIIDDFKRQSVLLDFGKRIDDSVNRFELLFYMQHYGVPTRLLDWTANPFIALFFALTDPSRTDDTTEDVAVWILDAIAWNEKTLKELAWEKRGPAYPDDKEISTYHPKPSYTANDLNSLKRTLYPLPVAVYGGANNARMFAQKGVFTCFGAETVPMESIYQTQDFPNDSLVRILVKSADTASMLETLISIGYTDSVSFPDMHGLALEIKRLRGFRT